MIGAAAYLFFVGFPLFGVLACGFYLVGLLSLGFVWILCRVRIPIKLKDSAEKSRRGRHAGLLAKLLSILVLVVGLNALSSVWPTLDKADMRLGLILATLAWLLDLSIRLIHPPRATASLRSLRSQLAFAKIQIEAARDEAERIMHGSPEEDYVTAKAEEVTAELEDYKLLCESVGAKMERLIVLVEEVKASLVNGDQFKEGASELRLLIRSMLTDMDAMGKRMQAAKRLRSELRVRVEAAKMLLNIHPDKLKAIVARVDAFGKSLDAARQKITDPTGRFNEALKFAFETQKGISLPRRLTFPDTYAALFRD